MPLQTRSDIVRQSDGSIDIKFYARRASRLRNEAKAELFASIGDKAMRGLRSLARLMPGAGPSRHIFRKSMAKNGQSNAGSQS